MAARLIDLSHTLAPGMLSFPGDPEFRLRQHAAMPAASCNVAELTMGTHQGTHVDAPAHFYIRGTGVDAIPLEAVYGPASLVDLGVLAPKTAITREMFEAHEAKFGRGARVVYRTGWDKQFGMREFFTDYPTLTLDAARWIASRGIALLGMDTPTPSNEAVECHRILLAPGVEIVILEGLANLGKVPERFTLAAFPLKIAGGDGAPVRAVAIVD
jgi:arylformamidase